MFELIASVNKCGHCSSDFINKTNITKKFTSNTQTTKLTIHTLSGGGGEGGGGTGECGEANKNLYSAQTQQYDYNHAEPSSECEPRSERIGVFSARQSGPHQSASLPVDEAGSQV